MSLTINIYYRKQERCRQLATDGTVPISEADMVLKLQIHMGKSGMVNGAYTKWKRKASDDRKWAPGKIFLRLAIKEVGNITKLAGESDFSANSLTQLQKETQDTVRKKNGRADGRSLRQLGYGSNIQARHNGIHG